MVGDCEQHKLLERLLFWAVPAVRLPKHCLRHISLAREAAACGAAA